MKFKLSKSSVKEAIFPAYDEYRSKTFALFSGYDEATFFSQPHSDSICYLLVLGVYCLYQIFIAART